MEDGPGRVPRVVAWLAAVAAVTYSSWVLGFLLRPGLDVIDGYVSELSASDQPLHWVFAGGDLVTGVIMIGVSIYALVMLRRLPWAVAGWIFLLLFGFWAIGDATFSMDCAPSMDTACALRERAGQVSFSHGFHSVTSSAVITCGIAALLCLSIAARRYGWWPALARWGWPLALVEAVAAAGTLVLMWAGRWLGLVQRIQITILCLGLFLIAWALWQRPRPRRAGRAAGREEAAV
ncbi:DUF998 domain-containing protein [Actinocorallia longicatena]|uniref:DUF998 domain-containing protein n=1 Tax=Actinocorallia longicatena TaxID=111803 RepID=A0ABP6Q316_9ACTN